MLTQKIHQINGLRQLIDPSKLDTEGQRYEAMFKFLRERHLVYLRRAQGQPAPWTEDWILQSYRFCNIYRELDTVTLWIARNLLAPNNDHPDLWWFATVARFFNKPSTLQFMLENDLIDPDNFKPAKFMAKIENLRTSSGPVFNPAYIINGVPKKGSPNRGSKVGSLAYDVFEPILAGRQAIRDAIPKGFQATLDALGTFHGMGPFMANQIAVDLSYSSKALKNAHDLNTVISPGPGTAKGIKFILGTLGKEGTAPRADQYTVMQELRRLSHLEKYWPVDSLGGSSCFKGFVPLTIPNVSNSCCETSKYMGLVMGLRGRLKNGYEGGPGKTPQITLF
jgi:hypothetical protein